MYEALGDASLRTRIEFRHAEPDDDPSSWVSRERLAQASIAFAYIDASTCPASNVLNVLGAQLEVDHPPYVIAERGWVRFMDDLETLAYKRAGLVIVVDNAGGLFSDSASWVFDLLKWWTMQIWHWAKQDRPCQLLFQMDTHPAVRSIYAPG